jgi:hypothetical protein
MALSNSILSYQDCREFLEKALDATNGSRVPFRNERSAQYFQMRCNQFRSLDRKDNLAIHDPGTLMHGKSTYDELTLTLKWSPDGLYWVYAQKRTLPTGLVEDIPEDETVLIAQFDEVKLLEDQSNGEQE